AVGTAIALGAIVPIRPVALRKITITFTVRTTLALGSIVPVRTTTLSTIIPIRTITLAAIILTAIPIPVGAALALGTIIAVGTVALLARGVASAPGAIVTRCARRRTGVPWL